MSSSSPIAISPDGDHGEVADANNVLVLNICDANLSASPDVSLFENIVDSAIVSLDHGGFVSPLGSLYPPVIDVPIKIISNEDLRAQLASNAKESSNNSVWAQIDWLVTNKVVPNYVGVDEVVLGNNVEGPITGGGAQRSWVEVAGGWQPVVVMGRQVGGKHSLQIKTTTHRGLPSLWISEEEICALAQPLEYALVGKFLNRRSLLEPIRKFFFNLKLIGDVLSLFWIQGMF
ncbi:hypothetical protein IEQ34_013028 [Dendrobium chrysotoxum]|uniref:Uncharacterized protein n=1 Tax=Dendrobium chrysotoxum TaxID=161865 RepID=A0AAV7GQA2_DENCH|nr:hypothetical protein IEQ34_013028 [Dendrobium chrysotoxum]